MINDLLTFLLSLFNRQRLEREMTDRHIDKIIIHCSATPASMDIGVEEIKKWHTDPKPIGNGWSDIGYHDIIRRDGTAQEGRPLSISGAHTRGQNKDSIGICLIGGVDNNNHPEKNFTKDQFKTLNRLLRLYRVQYPKATIHGHREFANKSCPSFDVQEYIRKENI